jgi:ribosomal protein S18 acetylase RimI-like enzyme
VLLTAGFERDDGHALKLRCQLDHEVVPQQLAPGFSVRAVGGVEELPARVELHRDVWHPSKVTLPAYERLRSLSEYQPELDLVVVAPDGRLAAYALCWLDPINQTGEFEPVGTHADFRGQGLGKAVMQEGLRRLRQHGAKAAYVTAIGGNEAARGLYESVGFATYTVERFYKQPL